MSDASAMRHEELDTTANEWTGVIVDEAIHVHRTLGAGLNEWVYRECLTRRLVKRGFAVEQRKKCAAFFEGERLDRGFELDILVNDAIILELKAVEDLHPAHFAQLKTYLRMTDKRVGLLMNFHAPLLKQGLIRVFNPSPKLRISDPPRESWENHEAKPR